jgi:hypothetical protein
MSDFGLASNGTEVHFATCMDERHPPENIVDGYAERGRLRSLFESHPAEQSRAAAARTPMPSPAASRAAHQDVGRGASSRCTVRTP